MKADLNASLVGTAAGTAFVAASLTLSIGTLARPQPGFVPLLGGVALLALSLILAVQSSRAPGTVAEEPSVWRRPAMVVAVMAAQAALLDRAGYILSTLVVTAIVLRALGVTSRRILAAASVTLSLGTYLLFAWVLGVDLPTGILGSLG
jgi:hypothetical protein